MTLRAKTLLVLGSTLAATLAVVYLGVSRAVEGAFDRLDSDGVQRGMQAVLDGLAAEARQLDASTERWARELAPGGPTGGGRGEVMVAGHAPEAFVAAIDASGALATLACRGECPGGDETLRRRLASHLAANPELVRHAHSRSSRSGVIMLSGQAAIVASRPLLAGPAPGAVTGAVLAGRFLDARAFERLGADAQVSLSVEPADRGDLPDDYAEALALADGMGRTVVRPLADGWIAGYRLVADLAGRPAIALRVDAPRNAFVQGRAGLAYLVAALLVIAAAFAAVSYLVLDRTILQRLARLSGEVARIGASRNPSARVTAGGRDEVAALATRINQMLDARERAQDDRVESEGRYRAVFEQGGDGIVLFDSESGQVLDANRAAQQMVGYTFSEMLNLRVSDLFVGPESALDEHLRRVRSERVALVTDVEFRRKDGSTTTGDATSSIVALRGREVVCSVVRDTSKRRQLEARLRRSQKLEAVGRLAAGVAHDFNNLLQAVLSSVGLLRAGGADPAVRSRAVDAIDAQVASGAALTRQLSLLGRQGPSSSESLDLNELVGETTGFLRRVMRETLRFDVALADGPLLTVGDRGRLEQSLINLVTNASEAMGTGGTVSVRTGRADAGVWFEVGDDGPGIVPEVRERLFEPFFTTRGDASHAGLGLTVVQHVVEALGGVVAVTSRPGTGTSIRVTLPARSDAASPAAPSRPAVPLHEPARGERILLIEDGEETRRGLADMLTLLGYEVAAVANGEEALAAPAGATADLVLTDYMLPGMDGARLARNLLERRPELRVIVISGYAAENVVPSDDERIRYVPKPFNMDTLAREVRAALGAPPADPHPTVTR